MGLLEGDSRALEGQNAVKRGALRRLRGGGGGISVSGAGRAARANAQSRKLLLRF